MIKTADIMRAVNAKLREDFADYKVCSTDARKNVQPGSFFVERPAPVLDGTQDMRHESGTIRVVYFPKDELNYRTEFMDMQNKLYMSFFHILRVTEDFVIPVNDLTFEETDGALIMEFDYETWQEIEETGEMMEYLNLR